MGKNLWSLVIMAVGVACFFYLGTMSLCGSCAWYDLFCHAGNVLCAVQESIFHIVARVIGVILFIVGAVRLAKA